MARTTAYLTYALVESGYAGQATAKGIAWLKDNHEDVTDAYGLAMFANALVSYVGYTGKLELTDAWHVLKISHRGGRIRAYLDGDMKLMVNSGEHITQKGGVGLWTKADAATSFDNFTVVSHKE